MNYKHVSNLILIGMPGAGKSTVGVILAKHTARDFIDTDVLLQVAQCKSLQQILDEKDYMVLRKIEEDILISLNKHNHVIATGGSAIYSSIAMKHLKINGTVVFLDVDITTLEMRVHDFETRGIARSPEQTFHDLYNERVPLYNQYADIKINCTNKTQEDIAELIAAKLDH